MVDDEIKDAILNTIRQRGCGSYFLVHRPTYPGSPNWTWMAEAELNGKRVFLKHSNKAEHEHDILERLRSVEGVPNPIACERGVLLTEKAPGSLLVELVGVDRPSLETVKQHLTQILERIHEKGIVHCDVRPWNILFDRSVGFTLLDFGFSFRIENGPLNHVEGHLRERGHEGVLDENVDWRDLELTLSVLSGGITPEEAWRHAPGTFAYCIDSWS